MLFLLVLRLGLGVFQCWGKDRPRFCMFGRMFQASVFFVAWWWGAWLCVWGGGGGGCEGSGVAGWLFLY